MLVLLVPELPSVMPLLLYHSFYPIFHVLPLLTNTAYWHDDSINVTVRPLQKRQYILIFYWLLIHCIYMPAPLFRGH